MKHLNTEKEGLQKEIDVGKKNIDIKRIKEFVDQFDQKKKSLVQGNSQVQSMSSR